tara:strand:+ start:515 stop:1006 length:492 start_codon:yes stop_codon:yes gene_type:complete
MKHGKSTTRVLRAATELGLSIDILEMPSSTRTADDAAQACGCIAAQIIKSIIVVNTDTDALILFLVSGSNNIDLLETSNVLNANLTMAKPTDVKNRSGFAIGGVSPLGHKTKLETYFDSTLLQYNEVWAAAGHPNIVFKCDFNELIRSISAKFLPISCFIERK